MTPATQKIMESGRGPKIIGACMTPFLQRVRSEVERVVGGWGVPHLWDRLHVLQLKEFPIKAS